MKKKTKPEYDKQYYLLNRDSKLAYAKKYREHNREKVALVKKKWNKENRERLVEKRKKQREQNGDLIRAKERAAYYRRKKQKIDRKVERCRERRKVEPLYRITNNLRKRLHDALSGKNKSAKTLDLLGCSIKELKTHLENQFTEGMSWDNYGFYGWHIDHIKPCASFNLSCPLEQRQCFNYKNLQPLWAKDNMNKSDTWYNITND